MVSLRSFMVVLTMFCLFSAAPQLDFTQMAAGLYLYPLFTSLLAVPILGERLGIWRVTALAVGLMGAGLTLRPWASDFSLNQILPIMAGFLYALNVILIRKSRRQEKPVTLAFFTALFLFVSGVVGLLVLSIFPAPSTMIQAMPFVWIPWQPLSLIGLVLLGVCSMLNSASHVMGPKAYQSAPSSLLTPISFTCLPLAVLWGVVLHDESPSLQTLCGMALIASAGIVVVWYESRKKHQT